VGKKVIEFDDDAVEAAEWVLPTDVLLAAPNPNPPPAAKGCAELRAFWDA
jgi:hypothetical protein